MLPEDIRSFSTRALFPRLWNLKKSSALSEIQDISVWLGSTGSYPYTAMAPIIVSLSDTDPDKAKELFSQAVGFLPADRYLSTPDWYVDFLLETSKVIAGPQLVDAIKAGLKSIDAHSKRDDVLPQRTEISAGKITVRLDSEADLLVYRLLPLIQSLDPDWAKSVRERFPKLAQLPAMAADADVKISGAVITSNASAGTVQSAMDESKLRQLMSLATSDPEAAWNAAFVLGDPNIRAIALAQILPLYAQKEAGASQTWLPKLAKIADAMDAGPNKLRLWRQLSSAYFSLKQEPDAERYLSRALDLGQELFAQSTREHPGQMAYLQTGFDELMGAVEVAGAHSAQPYNVLERIRQVSPDVLRARLLVHLAQGLASAAKA